MAAKTGQALVLSEEQCLEADREFVQFYHRRICWLTLRHYARALADAIRDVRDRLPTLDGNSNPARIAFLMVAYDSPRLPIDGAIQRFVQLGRLASWAAAQKGSNSPSP